MSAAKGLTRPQMAAYFAAAAKAAKRLGIECGAYRRMVMREECGVSSSKELRRGDQYEKVMLRFARDSENYALASRVVCGDTRRLAAMVQDCVEQALLLADSPAVPSDYVAGILKQSRLAARHSCVVRSGAGGIALMDIPEGALRTVFQIIETYRRRLLKRHGWTGRMAFRFGQRISFCGNALFTVSEMSASVGYAKRVPSVMVNVRRS